MGCWNIKLNLEYSKLDELVREIQSIKQSVGSTTPLAVAAAPMKEPFMAPRPGWTPSDTLAALAKPAHAGLATGSSSSNTALAPTSPLPHATRHQDASVSPSQPRALGSQPFSGEDIDYYFQKLVWRVP